MKKILFALALFFVLTHPKAQTNVYHPFQDSGAVWSEFYHTTSSNGYYVNGLLGDTILNSLTWHKLYVHTPNQMVPYDTLITAANSTLVGGIREDSAKRIFLYSVVNNGNLLKDSIYKLYDFSKNIGDTVFFTNQFPTAYAFQYLVVYGIDSVLVNQQYRKRFDMGMDKWIEGVGGEYDVLSSVLPRVTCTCYDELICYNYRGAHYYKKPSYLGCFPFTGVDIRGYDPKENVSVFPVPANDQLFVSVNSSDHFIVKIMDVNGALVRELKGNGKIEMETSTLKAGVYMLTIVQFSHVVNRKLIIVH